MKKLLAIAVVFIGLSFTTNQTYKLEWTKEETNNVFNTLETVQRYLHSSNLPHQDVVKLVGGIDSVKNLIVKQVRPQLPAAKKK